MTKPRGILLSLIWMLVCGCGKEVGRGVVEEKVEQPGCVWVVEGKSGGRLHLCGTIHLLRESDYPLPKTYEAAYEASEELLLELPPGAGGSAELTMKLRERGMLPEGEALRKLITGEQWKRVAEWSGKRGLDAASMDQFRPWFLSLLMVATEYQALGAAPDRGVDQYFEDKAKRDGKPGAGLETVEQQLALFSGMTTEQEREVLEQTLGELETVEAEFENMIRAWRGGDLEGLQGLLFREAERYPDLMESFLNARNRAWVPKLEEVLNRGGKAMVLVGAGHLGGEQGVIRLLSAKGHKVRQLGR